MLSDYHGHAENTPPDPANAVERLQQLECGTAEWLRVRERPAMEAASSLRVVDLFSGCGGMTLGVQEACRSHGLRLEVALAVDAFEDATRVYADNFGAKNVLTADLASMLPGVPGVDPPLQQVGDFNGRVDVLVAGPPCQGHSDLNNHTRRNDSRNALYLKAIRFAETTTPSLVIIENVPAVRRARENVVQSATARLEELGYKLAHIVIDASRFGVAQRRRRLLLVAALGVDPARLDVPEAPAEATTVRSVIEDLVEEPATSSSRFRTPSRMSQRNVERACLLRQRDAYVLPDEERPPCHASGGHSYVSMYGRMKWDEPAQTITTGFGSMGQGRYLHPDGYRMITPHEAARIQGFPDFFRFESVQKRGSLQRLIGNAVPPAVIYGLVNSWLRMRSARPISVTRLHGRTELSGLGQRLTDCSC